MKNTKVILNNFIARIKDEKKYQIHGGIYHALQVDFAYNSNHIEGSRLTHDQTKYIFDTKTVGIVPAKVDDIIETVNHFRLFDYVIETMDEELTEDYIKHLHYILKNATFSSESMEAVIGDYKKYPNEVSDIETALPSDVGTKMKKLLHSYNEKNIVSFEDIVGFHADFEKIHPFYDGNGRVGRILILKECLKNDIIPFYIDDKYKFEYYRGLKEWQNDGDKTYLRETCLFMQDHMKKIFDYFQIDYQKQGDEGGDDGDADGTESFGSSSEKKTESERDDDDVSPISDASVSTDNNSGKETGESDKTDGDTRNCSNIVISEEENDEHEEPCI